MTSHVTILGYWGYSRLTNAPLPLSHPPDQGRRLSTSPERLRTGAGTVRPWVTCRPRASPTQHPVQASPVGDGGNKSNEARPGGQTRVHRAPHVGWCKGLFAFAPKDCFGRKFIPTYLQHWSLRKGAVVAGLPHHRGRKGLACSLGAESLPQALSLGGIMWTQQVGSLPFGSGWVCRAETSALEIPVGRTVGRHFPVPCFRGARSRVQAAFPFSLPLGSGTAPTGPGVVATPASASPGACTWPVLPKPATRDTSCTCPFRWATSPPLGTDITRYLTLQRAAR